MATLSVPASLEQLANVNTFIHETIPSSYRPLIPQVELAAEELLVNVFSYAYPDVPGEAQVACREVRLDNVPYFASRCRTGAPLSILFLKRRSRTYRSAWTSGPWVGSASI